MHLCRPRSRTLRVFVIKCVITYFFFSSLFSSFLHLPSRLSTMLPSTIPIQLIAGCKPAPQLRRLTISWYVYFTKTNNRYFFFPRGDGMCFHIRSKPAWPHYDRERTWQPGRHRHVLRTRTRYRYRLTSFSLPLSLIYLQNEFTVELVPASAHHPLRELTGWCGRSFFVASQMRPDGATSSTAAATHSSLSSGYDDDGR